MKRRPIFNRNRRFPLATGTVSKSADASLTEEECWYGLIRVTAASKAMTLPAASNTLEGCLVIIQGYTGTTVVCAAGFDGQGAGDDTVTLQNNSAGFFYCDGTYWHSVYAAAPA